MTTSGVIFCKQCGAQNARASRFCGRCGTPLREAPPAPPAAVSAPPVAAPPAPMSAAPAVSEPPSPPAVSASPPPDVPAAASPVEDSAVSMPMPAAGERTAPAREEALAAETAPSPVSRPVPPDVAVTPDLPPREPSAPPAAAVDQTTTDMLRPLPPEPEVGPLPTLPLPTSPDAAATIPGMAAAARPAGEAAPGPAAGIIYCRVCGAKNLRDSQYCDQCSAPLHGGGGPLTTAPAPPPPPPASLISAPPGLAPPGVASEAVPAAGPPTPAPALGRAPAPSPVSPAATAPPPPPTAAANITGARPAAPEAARVVPGTSPAPAAATPTLPATAPARPTPRPAARRGPPWLLIGGAVLALIIFVGVGFSGLLTGISSNNLQNNIATAVAEQGTAQAEQGSQIRLALTQLANSGGSLAAQQTAIVQATAADAALRATATAVIAKVATISVEQQSAQSNKGPGGEQIVVVPVVFPPPPARSFITPPPLPSPQTFSGAPGADADHAVAVGVPVTITNRLADENTAHWYKIDLHASQGGTLVLTLSAPKTAGGTTRLTLLDEPGVNQVNLQYVNPATSGQIVASVAPGVYTVRVDNAASGQNPYTLSVDLHPNAANHDKNSAAPLGLVGSVQAFKNSEDDEHWFLVDMSKYPQGGKFVASLTVPATSKGSYEIDLRDAAGANTLDVQYVNPGQNNQVSGETRTSTNYYVVVKGGGYSWDEPYTIGTYFLPHSSHGAPGLALPVTPPIQAKVRIAAPEDVVYFSFQINTASRGTVKIQTPPDSYPVEVALVDSNDHDLYGLQDVAAGQQTNMDGYLPNPGTYLLRIAGRGGTATPQSPVTLDLQVAAQK